MNNLEKTLTELKELLQNDNSSAKLEKLAAALLGRMLDVPIAIAKSGFQYGGDAGTAGRQGRRLRIECKKYSDKTSLSDRELLGEIDHALSRDNALEGWILVATREASEQLEMSLTQKGEDIGVPVIILDWKKHGVPSMAAMCAFAPDLVEEIFSPEAGSYARAIQPMANDAIEHIKRNLQSWCLGFESLKTQAHNKLSEIWGDPKASQALLGQDAAVGAQPKRIKRVAVNTAIDGWWKKEALKDAPLTIVGGDGVGKTWATLDWLHDNYTEQPIILVVPSSAAAKLTSVSDIAIKEFIASRLYELGGKRDANHWLRRLGNLLSRPLEEGPVITIFFDGMNQEPSVNWVQILKILQGSTFEGKVRVITSTRLHHLTEKLLNLRSLVVQPIISTVDDYDTAPDSELDQMLALEGLTRSNLHSDLIELAKKPRLFKLVVKLRDKLVDVKEVTVHRLLWAYGRDTFNEQRAFSDREWHEWLKEVAKTYREGVRVFTIKKLGETTSHADLSHDEVFARLSDIIDGRFAEDTASGELQLSPTTISHALAVALLSHLKNTQENSFDAIDHKLSEWLDPIDGLDQRAEILRAAVSILIQSEEPGDSHITSVLVTQWLQTQNITDRHRHEIATLATSLILPLLITIEHSCTATNSSARLWAINALREIPRSNIVSLSLIVNRIKEWFYVISKDVDNRSSHNKDHERHKSERLERRIGVSKSGTLTVLGLPLNIVDFSYPSLCESAASIIQGFPLEFAAPIFEAAAISNTIDHKTECWRALKWLCLFNDVDPNETAIALRKLANEVASRMPEHGINPLLPKRAAALLFWLTGYEADDEKANKIDPNMDDSPTYENDYLTSPGSSFFFPLERRHAFDFLSDKSVAIFSRISKARDLLLDPTFTLPPQFIAEIRKEALKFPIEKLNSHHSRTLEDHHFEDIEIAIARCAPDVFATIARKRLSALTNCQDDSSYWLAIHSNSQFVSYGESAKLHSKNLRNRLLRTEASNHAYAAAKLLILEIDELPAVEQFITIIEADLSIILTDLENVIKEPSSDDIDSLISHFHEASEKKQEDLIVLLSINPINFSDMAWNWITLFTNKENEFRGVAFKTLSCSDAYRFGKFLDDTNWSWSATEDNFWVNHFGSIAIAEANVEESFEEFSNRIAPWLIIATARNRGSDVSEIIISATIFSHVLQSENLPVPDVGSSISIHRSDLDKTPFSYSIDTNSLEEEYATATEFMAAMDFNSQRDLHRRAYETARLRISEARKSGASLYLTEVSTSDFLAILENAPEFIDAWLDGMSEISEDFKRRVKLAEAAYLSLCEALLSHDPNRGAILWRALRHCITTRFIGFANIDELIHIPFRAPDSDQVTSLRDELFEIEQCFSDKALFDIAIASSYNNKTEWLRSKISEDQNSLLAWRKTRAIALSGYMPNNSLPVQDAWPERDLLSSIASLKCKSARTKFKNACAHSWWESFKYSETPEDAYASWVLFLNSADKRSYAWLEDEIPLVSGNELLLRKKIIHVDLNRRALERLVDKQDDKSDKSFLSREIINGIDPWGKM